MDVVHPHFTVRTSFSFLLLILLQTSAEATNICSGPSAVEFAENNTVGAVVATITVQPGVTLELLPPSDTPNNPFRLIENQLIATSVLDYETEKSHVAKITCHDLATSLKLNISIVIIVVDKNDNPPVFNQNPYLISVNEMSPVGATVGIFPATDLDEHYELYYTLTSDSNHFKLKSPTIPEVLIQTSLDYDKVKNVQLVLCAQDTQLKTTATRASFTATTTIMVTILDGDNRPPWFQPCAMHEVGGAVICQNAGYNGTVTLNEQEVWIYKVQR